MAASGSVTRWIDGLCTGESVAAQKLWEAYFHRLVELARKRLRALPRRAADEEDVALCAFDSFCRGAEQGRFPRLDDRHDLWQVLLVLTQRKAADLAQHEAREKRDWRRAEPIESACPPGAPPLAPDADPAFAAQVAEECQRLLDALGEDGLRLLAVRKMEGYTNEEIAGLLNCSLATVERRLRLIRRLWEEQGNNGS
jgi:DNA-directed RNA polymerase specialized sigma24 family protein